MMMMIMTVMMVWVITATYDDRFCRIPQETREEVFTRPTGQNAWLKDSPPLPLCKCVPLGWLRFAFRS